MKATEKIKMYEDIQRHGDNLNAIFNTGLDSIRLSKKLHSLEKKAHFATTCLCNTNTLDLMELSRYNQEVEQATEEQQNKFFDAIRKKVVNILGEKSKDMFFINFDPRGYALKLKSEFVKDLNIYKDFGGSGIIAPDFTPNN